MNDSAPQVEAEISRKDFQKAILDATRALVLQNARLSLRRDPIRRWRTKGFESTLQTVGTIAATIGIVAAATLLFLEWTDTGEVHLIGAGLLVVMVVLLFLFQNIQQIQTRALQFTNSLLAKRADAMLAGIGQRVPASVGYSIMDGEIRGGWTDNGELVSSWSHTLKESSYALFGEASIALFDDKEARAPACFCFFSTRTQGARLREMLEANDVDTETLDASLMPESTLERPWPSLLSRRL
jgi:hypothetical protein